MGNCCVTGTNSNTTDLPPDSTLDNYYSRESHKKIEARTGPQSKFAPDDGDASGQRKSNASTAAVSKVSTGNAKSADTVRESRRSMTS